MRQYVCPACGTNDLQKYLRCNMPNCPDGRDRDQVTRRVQPPLDVPLDYEHKGLYVYDATSGTFHPSYFKPDADRESWAAWLGRRCADGLFWALTLLALKWLGLIIIVEKVKWPVNQW